jgi:hypothetical protein
VRSARNNPLFSFIRGAMVPRRTTESVERRARKASYTPGFLGVKSTKQELEQLRLMREIAKLGRREKNSVTKKKAKKNKRGHGAKPKRRVKKNTRPRRRMAKRNPKRRTLTLNLALNTKQKRTLASFLRRATGRRVKVQ